MKKTVSLIISVFILLSALPAVLYAEDYGERITFDDVRETRWSYEYISYAAEKGYMNGISEGVFDPEGNLSRAMAVTVLWRLSGSESVPFSDRFSDVGNGKWFTTAIMWGYRHKIATGKGNRLFDPNSDITREQLAAIICRYAEYEYVKTDSGYDISDFSDRSKVSGYAEGAIAFCVKYGIITGYTETTLNPRGKATREQFAAILVRYINASYRGESEMFEYNSVFNEPVLQSTYTEKEYTLQDDADIFVSVSGNDGCDGKTKETAVKSFARAAELAKELKKEKTDDIRVAFMAGNYGHLNNLTLSSENGGDEERKIIYCAYGDGDVIFDNGITLYGKDFTDISEEEKKLFPRSDTDKIKKLKLNRYLPSGLPENPSIYGDTDLIWEARIPNKYKGADSYYDQMTDTLNDKKKNMYDLTLKICPPLTIVLDRYDSIAGAKIIGYLMYGWRVDEFTVKSYDGKTNLLKFDEDKLPRDFYTYVDGAGIRTPQMNLDRVYFSNLPAFLDDDGEYWYDRDKNTIYVYNPGEKYSIAETGTFLTLSGCSNVSFIGLTFRNCLNQNGIVIRDSSHVTFDRCTVSGIQGKTSAVMVRGNSDYLTVKECDFSNFLNVGLTLWPEFHRDTLESNHIVVDNCYFHDFGTSTIFSTKAIEDGGVGTVISHNIFRNGASAAIMLGTLGIIEYNVFDNMMSTTQDYGAIYIWHSLTNRQNQIRYNLFENMRNSGAQYGLYMDDYSQDQCIYGNIFYKCGTSGVMIHEAKEMSVHDNIFIQTNVNINGTGLYDESRGRAKSGMSEDGTGWSDVYGDFFRGRVNEGEPGYEIWKEAFPSLYFQEADFSRPNERTSIVCPYNEIYDNFFIGGATHIPNASARLGKIENNRETSTGENPLFTDPTHGDYTVREDAGFFKIPFEKIGRY